MRNLSNLAADLLAHPVCPTPPLHEVAARARLLRRRRRLTTAGLVALSLAIGQEFFVHMVKTPLL